MFWRLYNILRSTRKFWFSQPTLLKSPTPLFSRFATAFSRAPCVRVIKLNGAAKSWNLSIERLTLRWLMDLDQPVSFTGISWVHGWESLQSTKDANVVEQRTSRRRIMKKGLWQTRGFISTDFTVGACFSMLVRHCFGATSICARLLVPAASVV